LLIDPLVPRYTTERVFQNSSGEYARTILPLLRQIFSGSVQQVIKRFGAGLVCYAGDQSVINVVEKMS
jgi:hypothetical protein